MRRGTTPTIQFETDLDTLSEATSAVLTFKQGNTIVDKTKDDMTIDGGTFSVTLSQAETLAFKAENPSTVEVQLRVLTSTNQALASDIAIIGVQRILKGGEIT